MRVGFILWGIEMSVLNFTAIHQIFVHHWLNLIGIHFKNVLAVYAVASSLISGTLCSVLSDISKSKLIITKNKSLLLYALIYLFIHSFPVQASYLGSWPPPSPAPCSQRSSPCCPGTSGRCWGPRRRSHVAWGCMCRSSKRLPAPQQRLCGGLRSAAPGQSQTPPQRDFCPASSFAAADRWARETLCRKDMSETEIRNKLQNMPTK